MPGFKYGKNVNDAFEKTNDKKAYIDMLLADNDAFFNSNNVKQAKDGAERLCEKAYLWKLKNEYISAEEVLNEAKKENDENAIKEAEDSLKAVENNISPAKLESGLDRFMAEDPLGKALYDSGLNNPGILNDKVLAEKLIEEKRLQLMSRRRFTLNKNGEINADKSGEEDIINGEGENENKGFLFDAKPEDDYVPVFDRNTFDRILPLIKKDGWLPYAGRKEFLDFYKAAREASVSADSYRMDPRNVNAEVDFKDKYIAFENAYNKYKAVSDFELATDKATGVISGAYADRFNLSLSNYVNVLKTSIENVPSKKQRTEWDKRIIKPEQYNMTEIREQRKERLRNFDDLIEKAEEGLAGINNPLNNYKTIIRNLKEVNNLKKSLDGKWNNNKEKIATRKTMLLLENELLDKTARMMGAFEDNGGFVMIPNRVRNQLIYNLECIHTDISRHIAEENRLLSVSEPKMNSKKKNEYEELAKQEFVPNEFEAGIKENLGIEEFKAGIVKEDIIDDVFEDDMSEIEENNIGNEIEDSSIADNINNSAVEGNNAFADVKHFSFESDDSDQLFDDKGADKIPDNKEKNIINDKNEENRIDKLFDEEIKEFNEMMDMVGLDDEDERVNEKIASGKAIDLEAETKDVFGRRNFKDKDLIENKFEFEINDFETDMIEMLKMGNKKVYFGSDEYNDLITMAEYIAEAKKKLSEAPNDSKAYLDVLQSETKLNKMMDKYIARKDKEIADDIRKGKTPNFNSERRCNLVKSLREGFKAVRDRDIQMNPLKAIVGAIRIEEERRNDKKHPLTYDEYLRSLCSSIYLNAIKGKYDAVMAGEKNVSDKVKAGAKEQLKKDMSLNSYRNAVDSMRDALKNTKFETYLQNAYKKQGGDAFLPMINGKVNDKAVTAISESLDYSILLLNRYNPENIPKGISSDPEYFKQLCARHDNMIGIIMAAGFGKALKDNGIELKTSAKLIEEQHKLKEMQKGGKILK